MASPIPEAERQRLIAQVNNTPGARQALIANFALPQRAHNSPRRPVAEVLKPFGIDLPHDYRAEGYQGSGPIDVTRDTWFERNSDWFMPLVVLGSAGVGGGLTSGAAAAPAYGPLAGGYGGATTSAAVPASIASPLTSAFGTTIPATVGTAGGGTAAAQRALAQAGGANKDGWMEALGPLLGLGTTLAMTAGQGNRYELDPEIKSRIMSGLDMQNERARAQQPIHAAAMKLAGNLAPNYANSPRMTSAISDATRPAANVGTDPAVLAAINRLMGR